MPEIQTMEYPAPRRCSEPSGNGKWCSRPYTIRDVIAALTSGAWFMQGRHDFADEDAKTLAMKYS